MKKNNSRFAILVVGFDGYSDLWNPFFELLRKNWENCQYKIYFVTNVKKPVIQGIHVITTESDCQWSTKTVKALNMIDEDFVYLLLEDYFICDKVNENRLEELFDYIIQNDIKYVKTPFKSAIVRKKIPFKDKKDYYCIPKNLEYGISLLPGIWDKNYLLGLIGNKDYNPWQFEVDRIKETRDQNSDPFVDKFVTYINPLNLYNGVIQGKYDNRTYKLVKKQRIDLPIGRIGRMKKGEEVIFYTKTLAYKFCPESLKQYLKKIARIFGISFVTDKNM